MYWPEPGIKRDAQRRWNLPDRIFFGHGACHILDGVFLEIQPLPGFYAERIVPNEGFLGNHIYVTNGSIAFDFHGYSARERLLRHHRLGWSNRYQGWTAEIERLDFSLLDTAALNARKMLGPDQYFRDPAARAERFIARVDHMKAAGKAERTAAS
jgi:hypothetical protein